MSNLLVNVRDQHFLLFEQFGVEKLFATETFKDFSKDDVLLMMNEAEKMALNVILPTYEVGDKEGCTFKDGKVTVPKCYHDEKCMPVNGEARCVLPNPVQEVMSVP
ncbi:MAG: acyl-CoA dehydrogenase N-terminal domain-containing protein [Deltaproteobacteria bacterium]|nr:acyl-CoA dehydrogenase N-terminal domain-containing protein [Deltaproteobacteria bacterium]